MCILFCCIRCSRLIILFLISKKISFAMVTDTKHMQSKLSFSLSCFECLKLIQVFYRIFIFELLYIHVAHTFAKML